MRVRILGGGIAGLAGAVALRRRGMDDVAILERDSAAGLRARQGHGMILMPNAVAALRALGADGCLGLHNELRRAVIQDERGRVLRSEPMDGVHCVTRHGLVDALRAELPDDAVEHGRCCTRVLLDAPKAPHPGDGERRVRSLGFAAGPSLSAADVDLFVGAEGVRSALCAALNPGLVRARSRVFEVVMSARRPELAAELGATFLKTVLEDRGLAFGLLAPSADHVIGFLQFDTRRHGIPLRTAGAGLVDFAAAALGSPPEPVASFLRVADPATAHLWRPVDGEIAATACASNAVVIGDAAHPLLPFSSQGVGSALEDAVALADAIERASGRRDLLPRALTGFCEERRRDVGLFVDGGRLILSHFVGASSGFVAPYVYAGPRPPQRRRTTRLPARRSNVM
jgi:2-polyprenyl-6-methoxyphenol hydroxylase-like FAD-dependent oxidoreductase